MTVSTGPYLSEPLVSSPILSSDDGSGPVAMGASGGGFDGFQFGVDPNEDPELALVQKSQRLIMH